MLTLKEALTGKITLDIECVDRVYLNGYVKALQMPGGLVNFIREQIGWPIPSPQALGKLGGLFREAVEKYANEQDLEIIEFRKDDDKDQMARQKLAKFKGKSGVVLIGKAQEKTIGYKSRRADQGSKVWFQYSRQSVCVIHYYFYILDDEFGLCFIKVSTYMPFDVKLCFNGHEWAKQQLRKEGIVFKDLSNGFLKCENPARLQEICLGLDAARIQALFDRWVEQLPWPLEAKYRQAGYKHQLSVWQMEISRTQVFADAEQGRALVEALIKDNLDLGRPDRVSLIFERKVTKGTPGEFYTRVIREGVLPSIRIHYKRSGLKQYFKDGKALRTELMINNTYDFGFPRGLLQFGKIFELGLETNRRLLDQERLSQDCFMPLEKVRELTLPTHLDDGQRAGALRFGEQRAMALLESLSRHAYVAGEINNKTMRSSVAQLMGCSLKEYSRSQMSYDFRRLRLKGLIERIRKSHRYTITSLGNKAAVFFSKLYERIFRPGLSALVPNQLFPSDLTKALNTVDHILQLQVKEASLV